MQPVDCVDGFIIGFESQRKILPEPECLSNTETHVRYFIFKSINGDKFKVLAPEKLKDIIEKYSYVSIDIEVHNKNSPPVICAVKITEKAIGTTSNNELEINYNYERIMHFRWSYQSKSS